jgi:hypothetical protein
MAESGAVKWFRLITKRAKTRTEILFSYPPKWLVKYKKRYNGKPLVVQNLRSRGNKDTIRL